MPTTTAITLVNRVSRALRKGEATSVTDDKGAVLLDFVNASMREVLETAEWDFLMRSDGELVVVPRIAYTGSFLATPASTQIINVGQVDYLTFIGSFRTRLVITSDATHGGTSFAVDTAEHPTTSDRYHLTTAYPGTGGSLLDGFVYVVDYQLPATVRDVLSVRHEEDELPVEFVEKTQTFDRFVPTAHLVTQDSPDLVIVGGSVTSTVATGGTSTTAVGLMVWPVPTVAYVLSYSYRYLHPELTATTSTLDAPLSHADLIVDKACARAYRSAVANDPDMADRIEADVARRFQRLLGQNSPQPERRMVLRSHDAASGPSQFGSRPRDPRVFYTP